MPLIGLFVLFFALPLDMLLVSPAIAAHILFTGTPAQQVYLEEWRWGCLAALPLALVLVRTALSRDGRVRGSGWLKRWRGLLLRSVVLLGAMNAVAFAKLKPSAEHVIDDGLPAFFAASAVGAGVLVGVRLWDRRPRRVTVEEVRAAAAEADRALRRVRAENARVRRQAEQVQARLVTLRARGGRAGARPGGRSDGHPRGRAGGGGSARAGGVGQTGAGGAKQAGPGGPGVGGAKHAGPGGPGVGGAKHAGPKAGGAKHSGLSGAGQPERGGSEPSGVGGAKHAGAGGAKRSGASGAGQPEHGGGKASGSGGSRKAGAGGAKQSKAESEQAGAGGGRQGGARRAERAAQSGWDGASAGVDFQSLRVFHRESYQCADTAHMAYQSAQTSLRTMSYLVRRTRIVPSWVGLPGRAARMARAEMRAAAVHLANSHSELRVQVGEGLGMVRTLNANTSELKVEIRDSCGERGERWYSALEERIEAAREERRASRAW